MSTTDSSVISNDQASVGVPEPNPEVNLRSRRHHPGWTMLAIAAAAVFMSSPGQSFSVAAFVDPMLRDLKTDRTSYSLAYMVATLIGGLTLPFVGRAVDRFGARVCLPVVAVLLSAACGWMSQIGGVVSLYVGFTMIRCLGQGSLTLISNWILGEWFHDYRGRAAGLCALGGTASVLIVPQLNDFLITNYGWRHSWLVLGGAVCLLLVPPAILFLRDRPEMLGLLPDWKFPATGHNKATEERSENALSINDEDSSFTASEAIRSTAFWKVVSVVATVSLVGTGLMFHQVSILAERDVSRSMALLALGMQAFAATVSTLVAGYLIDRIPARFVLATSMVLEICAVLLLLFLPSPRWVLLYSMLLGLHGGIIRSAGAIVWINFFGRRHQGAIQGLAMSIMVIGAALGPVPLAGIHDLTGSYDAALWAFLVLPVCAGLAVLSASPPQRQCAG